jgi:hypothetical protein
MNNNTTLGYYDLKFNSMNDEGKYINIYIMNK